MTHEDKVWDERNELETFRNVERGAAYELRQAGYMQPLIWRQK
jgi:hypothetical protein